MKLFSLMVLLCASLGGYAQDIKGRVVEQENGKKVGLPGANVYWAGTTDGVVTDAEGHFKIKWNKSGRLVASFIGYRTDTLTVKRTDKQVEIELVAGEVLDEVKVVTRGNTTIMSTRGPLIEQVITGEELCKAACCNLGESFTTNASVDVAYADAVTGAKQIQLLGLTGKYVQMMTENMPNFRGISALYGLNYVPGPWMSAISVSKGAGSVINGYEAIAGQISVDYKKPATSEKIFVNAYGNSEGMIEFNANTGIRLNDKWSTAILAHGDWLTMEHDGNHDGFLDMPKTTQYNVMNRWQYKTDTWFLQFGGKFLDETRLGGQKGFRKEMRGSYGEGTLYGIGIDSRRYEGFLKLGYLMPQYENTSMAILVNYTDHDQDSYYGARDYQARQQTVFSNYIFQSIFGQNENQKYSAGLSFNFDRYDESFNDYLVGSGQKTATVDFDRNERVGGAFFQYTGLFWQKLTVMAGLRYDYHNIFGSFVTPRLHLADNSYLLASANSVYVNDKLLAAHPEELDRLDMEKAWNFGVQLNRKFLLFDRILNINLDYYRTNFTDQVVADNETQVGKVNFYNLDGDSYSNCYQVEVKYELIPRFDVLDSFRIMNAQISKFFRKWSIYAGCENIGDFTQKHPILAADRPWSDAFDSSKIWGPVHGRKFYLGLRFGLDRE